MVSDLLRLATIGSVDDGKSTLVGRLLVDTRQLFDDQLDAVVNASERRGIGDLDLAFVTDGLRAEREQGITIDVAYRYAATPTRKFIVADCPGHVQYTRNMATGASTADLALAVVDVTHGLREQTRRHLCIAALLGVRHLVVAVNKMDVVRWSPTAFRSVADEIETLAGDLDFATVVAVPTSALLGDNVVETSDNTTWYHGPTVLAALEEAPASSWASARGARLPIQWVLRQPGGGRTYAGMVAGATLGTGDLVTLLPAGIVTRITELNTLHAGSVASAVPGLSIDVALADETDAGRGDLLAAAPLPRVTRTLEATVCWFADRALGAGSRLRLKHTTRTTPVRIDTVTGVVDVDTLRVTPGDELRANDIGILTLTAADDLVVDDYRENRVTGSFILIDEATNATVAAGMVGYPGFVASPQN